MAAEHEGHRERMRSRYLNEKPESFAPHELLELLLFYAMPRKNVNPLAHDLINTFGSLHGVLDASVDQLCTVKGIGENAALLISLVHDLNRMAEVSRAKPPKWIKTNGDAVDCCIRLLHDLPNERFYAIWLDGQTRLIKISMLSEGSMSEAPVCLSDIAKQALAVNARCAILCHNHPGGTLEPSPQDVEVTREITDLLSKMDIRVIDHFIVAGEKCYSIVQEKVMEHTRPNGR